MRDFEIVSVKGLASFRDVYEMQQGLLLKRIDDQIPDTIIFCEHKPVITRGRGLQFQEGREDRAKSLETIPEGTDYVEIERGGDLTWHGPGQLVMYPIVKLGGEGSIGKLVGRDIDKWVRFLENVWIDTIQEFGIEGHTKAGGSGVWIRDANHPQDPLLKGVSVGIALRKWVNYHGTATNIVNDLAPFRSFEPCGFSADVMTRLSAFSGIPSALFGADWRAQWEMRAIHALEKLVNSEG